MHINDARAGFFASFFRAPVRHADRPALTGNFYQIGTVAHAGENVLGRLKGLEVNKKTVRVPADWKVDAALLRLMVKERLAELDD